MAVLVGVVCLIPAAARAQDGGERPAGTYTFTCADGSTATVTYHDPLTPEQYAAEQRAHCPQDPASAAPRAPAGPRPKIEHDDRHLFRQTLRDLRANRFTVLVTCDRVCTAHESVELVLPRERRLLYARSAAKRLPAGQPTKLLIKVRARDRAILRRARLVKLNGITTARNDGGTTRLNWRRTCAVGRG